MSTDEWSEGGPRINRRKLLGATAAGAAGLTIFAGSAGATDGAKQINFCGCSQVCVDGIKSGENFKVIIAYRDEDEEWAFWRVGPNEADWPKSDFCYTIEDAMDENPDITAESEPKIVAVGEVPGGDDLDDAFGNPTQCAQKALAHYDGTGNLSLPFANEVEGELLFGGPYGTPGVEIVQGRCGKPGKPAPGKP